MSKTIGGSIVAALAVLGVVTLASVVSAGSQGVPVCARTTDTVYDIYMKFFANKLLGGMPVPSRYPSLAIEEKLKLVRDNLSLSEIATDADNGNLVRCSASLRHNWDPLRQSYAVDYEEMKRGDNDFMRTPS